MVKVNLDVETQLKLTQIWTKYYQREQIKHKKQKIPNQVLNLPNKSLTLIFNNVFTTKSKKSPTHGLTLTINTKPFLSTI